MRRVREGSTTRLICLPSSTSTAAGRRRERCRRTTSLGRRPRAHLEYVRERRSDAGRTAIPGRDARPAGGETRPRTARPRRPARIHTGFLLDDELANDRRTVGLIHRDRPAGLGKLASAVGRQGPDLREGQIRPSKLGRPHVAELTVCRIRLHQIRELAVTRGAKTGSVGLTVSVGVVRMMADGRAVRRVAVGEAGPFARRDPRALARRG